MRFGIFIMVFVLLGSCATPCADLRKALRHNKHAVQIHEQMDYYEKAAEDCEELRILIRDFMLEHDFEKHGTISNRSFRPSHRRRTE